MSTSAPYNACLTGEQPICYRGRMTSSLKGGVVNKRRFSASLTDEQIEAVNIEASRREYQGQGLVTAGTIVGRLIDAALLGRPSQLRPGITVKATK